MSEETLRQQDEMEPITLDPPVEDPPVEDPPAGDPPAEDPPAEDPPPEDEGEPPVVVLPIPELPYGAVLVSFQANLPNVEASTAIIAPRMTQKMMRRVQDEGKMVDGVFVPKYSGLTEMFMMHVRQTLFADLNARYPEVDQEIALLEEKLAELKLQQMNKPEFIGGA